MPVPEVRDEFVRALAGRTLRGVVLDVDGTLYDQSRLRRRMAAEMVRGLLAGKLDLAGLKSIVRFRQLREQWASDGRAGLAANQFNLAATELGLPVERVERAIADWMERRPLKHLAECRYPGLEAFFELLRSRGLKIGLFSDYPIEDKLEALSLRADAHAYSLELEIDRLKPYPQVLLAVLDRLLLDPSECLVIGDRDDRDGACARATGAAFLLRNSRAFFEDLCAYLNLNNSIAECR